MNRPKLGGHPGWRPSWPPRRRASSSQARAGVTPPERAGSGPAGNRPTSTALPVHDRVDHGSGEIACSHSRKPDESRLRQALATPSPRSTARSRRSSPATRSCAASSNASTRCSSATVFDVLAAADEELAALAAAGRYPDNGARPARSRFPPLGFRLTPPSDRRTTPRAFRVLGTDCSDGAKCSTSSRDLSASRRPFPHQCTCGDPTSSERRSLDRWRPGDPPAQALHRIRRPPTGSRSALRT